MHITLKTQSSKIETERQDNLTLKIPVAFSVVNTVRLMFPRKKANLTKEHQIYHTDPLQFLSIRITYESLSLFHKDFVISAIIIPSCRVYLQSITLYISLTLRRCNGGFPSSFLRDTHSKTCIHVQLQMVQRA